MDDMPLFGEESTGKKAVTWGVVILLAAWVRRAATREWPLFFFFSRPFSCRFL